MCTALEGNVPLFMQIDGYEFGKFMQGLLDRKKEVLCAGRKCLMRQRRG